MNDKQQQLTFEKGITNVPSDALCSDNALEESLGMVYDNGEHRVIQKPVKVMDDPGGKILYIHKYNAERRYILLTTLQTTPVTYKISWRSEDGASYGDLINTADENSQVTSIGKKLIINDESGLHYFLWKNESPYYKSIDTKIPYPKLEVSLKPFEANNEPAIACSDPNWASNGAGSDFYRYQEQVDVVKSSSSHEGIFKTNGAGIPEFEDKKQEDYNNLVVGLYSRNKKAVAQNKCFCNPFFVRAALELYDGTYTHITNPILLFPSVKQNSWARCSMGWNYTMYTICREMMIKQTVDYSDYDDIVKEVVLFVSDSIDIYNTSMDIQIYTGVNNTLSGGKNGEMNHFKFDSIFEGYDTLPIQTTIVPPSRKGGLPKSGHWPCVYSTWEYGSLCYHYNPFETRDPKDIETDIKAASRFYKLCSIGKTSITNWVSSRQYIEQNTLENITNQQKLDTDDYYSGCSLVAKQIYSYNSRLNLAGIKRGFFEGFDFFIAWDNDTTSTYDIYVTIKTDSGEYTVRHQIDTGVSTKMDQYFYYPDSRASHVLIKSGSAVKLDADLTEHPSLNGAYYFAGYPQPSSSASVPAAARALGDEEPPENPGIVPDNPVEGGDTIGGETPGGNTGGGTGGGNTGGGETGGEGGNGNEGGTGGGTGGTITVNNNATELLPNYILQSEVNNPWVFKAAGYFRVGTGKIIGMSTITQALSEGQFGQFPLLVFSESGIWSLSVASTGYYDSIHPISREVSLDPACIVQTDGAVFFTSEKGLMVVIGSQVKCVSEQLSGKDISFVVTTEQTTNLGNFIEYLKNAYIAYDYRDSLLWIFNANYDACWVYSIKSGTFGKYDFGTGKKVTNVVNDYPDYLLQNSDGVLSLLQRPNINVDGTTSGSTFTPNTYNTKLITRPMKFENALALKSIMQIRHIKDFTPYTTTETVNEGTENEETITHHWPKTSLRIFASNNMDHWAELPSLRGMPWKYYKFCFDFSGLKAVDRFSGTMLVTQERRTNKMR